MRAVRRKWTSAERRVARVLRASGVKYTTNSRHLPGSPDFVLREHPIVIFVNGCFWHGCPRCYVAPKRNANWWADKVKRNVARDKRKDRQLRALGYSVLHLWEHDGPRRAELRIKTTIGRSVARRRR